MGASAQERRESRRTSDGSGSTRIKRTHQILGESTTYFGGGVQMKQRPLGSLLCAKGGECSRMAMQQKHKHRGTDGESRRRGRNEEPEGREEAIEIFRERPPEVDKHSSLCDVTWPLLHTMHEEADNNHVKSRVEIVSCFARGSSILGSCCSLPATPKGRNKSRLIQLRCAENTRSDI